MNHEPEVRSDPDFFGNGHDDLDELESDIYSAESSRLIAPYIALHWPNGIFYYKLSSDFDQNDRTEIQAAMQEIEDKTCVRSGFFSTF